MPTRQTPLYDENGNFSDLDITFNQDYLCWITQGPIAKRELEKLGEGDKGIILFRRMALEQLKLVQEGQLPTINMLRQPEDNQGFGKAVSSVTFNGSQILAVGANNEIFTYFATELYADTRTAQ